MEDEKIKRIFRDFQPDLSNDFQFMSQLKRSMDSVEIVMQHNLEVKRSHRKALILALSVGFICGILFSLFLPAIGEAMENLRINARSGTFLNSIANHYFPITLTLIAGALTFISINTYELSLFLMRLRR
ncbi:MAG: hypothetical protein K2N05_02330 [Muribaculaceae bacterium]|nr:hypothetical protein [Muribaculaceae bacterium]